MPSQMESLYSHVLEEGQYFSLIEKKPDAPSSNGDYVVMESGEPWLVFLGWLQRLLMQLHKHYQQASDWSSQENLKLTLCLQKQFAEPRNVGSVEKFAHFLSYGSHICLVLHLVNNDWIDRYRINSSEQIKNSDLLTGENIDLFRRICEKKLHIPSKSILPRESLQHLEEFGKLISTFVAISSSSAFTNRLLELGLQLQALTIHKYEPYNLVTYCEQSEYFSNKDLQQPMLVTSVEESLMPEEYDSVGSYDYPEHLSEKRTHAGSSSGDSPVPHTSQSELEAKIKKAEIKIGHILAEIESTEDNYSNQLQYLDSVYRNSLEEIGYGDLVKDVLDDTKITELSAATTSFLSDLIAAQGDVVLFAKAFIHPERIKFLVRYYTSYLKNCSKALEKLDFVLNTLTPEKQSILNKADDRAATGGSKSFDIKVNFRQPFQRFCRYPLLLNTLSDAVKKTEDPLKIETVDRALKTWKHITDHLNLVKADEEMSTITLPKVLARSGIIEEVASSESHPGEDKLKRSDSSLKSPPQFSEKSKYNNYRQYNQVEEFEKYGRFIKDEVLTVVVESGKSKKTHKYNVALTELQLIFNKNTILNLRMSNDMKYEVGQFTKSSKNSKPVSNIKLTHAKTSYILLFSSEYNFNSWKQKFDEVLDLCRKQPSKHKSHMFEYYSFQVEKDPVFCSACGFVLKGLVWQGHLCIICKSIAHPNCRTECAECVNPRLSVRPTGVAGRSASIAVLGTAERETMPSRANSLLHAAGDHSSLTFPSRKTCTNYYPSLRKLRKQSSGLQTPIEEQGWYIGMASKQVTKANLETFASTKGSFLVRLSDREPGYRLAVVDSKSHVKHIQIFDNENGEYFLEEDQKFKSIAQLIEFYRKTNLSTVFSDYIDAYLSHPLADICYDLIREYSAANEANSSHEGFHDDLKPVGAAILLKTVTAPNLDGGNYANLQQGQLVFISNETEDYFECTTSLAPLAPVLMVSQNDVRIITAYGVFGNEP